MSHGGESPSRRSQAEMSFASLRRAARRMRVRALGGVVMVSEIVEPEPSARGRDSTPAAALQTNFPGVLVSLIIAVAATFLSEHYGGPVMLFALLLGMAFYFLSQEG